MNYMTDQRTILLIDDEIDLLELVKIALQSSGYRVETACNGVEGLEKLKTITPQLIILDLNMPKMGGLLFYKSICDVCSQPKYPVLVLTARANMEAIFKEYVIDGFKAKPFEIDELLNEVDTIVNKRFGPPNITKVSSDRPVKVCVVEDDPDELSKIGTAFLNTGYVVNSISNGADAIEYVYENLPAIVLVKLSIPGVSGDAVILQLARMAKTKNIKYILYSQKQAEKTIIMDKISKKSGVDSFVQYLYAQELVTETNNLLRQHAA
jgi:DNA-binding response OmpR family regulator